MNESKAFYAKKYGLDNFEKHSIRADKYIAQTRRENNEIVAVFDIGTKAARVLFAKKRIPRANKNEWNSYAFFNDGYVFNLGASINPFTNKLDVEKSFALEGIIFFINHYLKKIRRLHIPHENVVITGTAVFRWLSNVEEVLNYIKQQTGLNLIMLHPRTEAFCSSLSILYTYEYNNRHFDARSLTDRDLFLVIDQGGGSTEISCFKPMDNSFDTKLDSINALGTVALETDYFKLIENYSLEHNKDIDIITHQKEYEKIIKKRIDKWDGLKINNNSGLIIHAFGIGGTLSKIRTKGNFQSHNEFFSHKSLNDTLQYFIGQFLEEFYYTKHLYRNVKWEKKLKENPELKDVSNRKRDDFLLNKILTLYGIPVYKAILDKFKVRGLRYVGFPLRYGIYLAKYHYEYDINELNQGYANEESENEKKKFKSEVISVVKLHHNNLIQQLNEYVEEWIFNISEDVGAIEEKINDINLELYELEHKALSTLSLSNTVRSSMKLVLHSSRSVNSSAEQKKQAIELLNKNKDVLVAEGADFIYNQIENCKIFTDLNISQYRNIKELLAEGENKNVEFKSTLSYCLKQKSKQAHVEHSVIKTLAAFLNSNGGKLFIGIADDKEVIGLEKTDFKVIKKSKDPKDGFNIHYDNLLNKYFGDNIFGFIEETKFYEWIKNEERLTICMINVKEKSSKPIFVKNKNEKEFYIRRNGSTAKLNVEDAYVYISKHWSKNGI